MRVESNTPARQLRSVAQRYQGPDLGDVHRPWWRRECSAPLANPMDDEPRSARQRRLEAVLLLAREPINSRKLAKLANLADGTEARTLVRLLNQHYDQCGRAFRAEELAGGFQLLTRPMFAAWLRRLEHVEPETRLSPPAMETLAVVAYRQPVLRADIEAIRGVNCGEILRQLMERELVRVSGRSEELGRPYLYSTTKRFLRLFGLPSIDKLPHVEPMSIEATTPSAALSNSPYDHAPLTAEKESEVTVTPAALHPQDTLEEQDVPDPRLEDAEELEDEYEDADDEEEFDDEEEDDEEEEEYDDEEDDDDYDDEEYEDDADEEEEEDDAEDEEEDEDGDEDDEEYDDEEDDDYDEEDDDDDDDDYDDDEDDEDEEDEDEEEDDEELEGDGEEVEVDDDEDEDDDDDDDDDDEEWDDDDDEEDWDEDDDDEEDWDDDEEDDEDDDKADKDDAKLTEDEDEDEDWD